MKQLLVRRPGPRLAAGLVTHVDRQPIDVTAALRQWEGYVAAVAAHGWDVIEVESAPDHPDSVFIEDTAVMFDGIAVAASPGAAERVGEVGPVRELIERLGYPVLTLPAGATLDGGDVLKVGRAAYVGISGRTNQAAVDALASMLTPTGWNVTGVPLTHVLHLKSALTALPDGTIIGWPPVIDDTTVFDRFIAMPDERGAHVVDLGGGNLLIDAAATASQRLLADVGYTPVPVEIDEFVKLEGCVTCLSIRIRSAPGR